MNNTAKINGVAEQLINKITTTTTTTSTTTTIYMKRSSQIKQY